MFKMDTYFQTTFSLPSEIVRTIYEFATMRQDLVEHIPKLRPAPQQRSLINMMYFNRWGFFFPEDAILGERVVFDRHGRVRMILFRW